MPPPRALSFTSAERMVNGIHGHASNDGPPTEPSISAGLAQGNILVFDIAHLTDGSITILEDQPNLPRRKLNMGISSLFRHQLSIGSRAAYDLTPFSSFQLDVMNQRSSRNISQRKSIARLNIGCRACHHLIGHFELRRCKDI